MLVSIIMAVYNGETYLKQAIASALCQTYSNIELIIVNDGSNDSTKYILDKIDDERVKVIHLPKNQGAANALNTGISQAKGEWIAIQDADDNSYPTRIEEQVGYIRNHSELVGVGTLVEFISGNSTVPNYLLKKLMRHKNSIISRQVIKKKRFYICELTHSSMMFSKNVFLRVGGYDTTFKILYDYDLWLRLLDIGHIEKAPKILLQYRIHKGSLSRRNKLQTYNEIQTASSRAIYRLLVKDKKCQPTVIVLGPKKACDNYKYHVAPYSGLKVDHFIWEDLINQVPFAVKDVKSGKVDAIILLSRDKRKILLQKLTASQLKLNKQVFVIYNIIK